ncbi:SagB/ThcOx family dehydrogenase [Oxalobacteraceae bacterium]|nr:SagB/ThcOx family dehydrogenase [Oxalobacteraceae bacterium]
MNKPRECQAALQLIAPSALALDAGIAPQTMTLLEVLRRRQSGRAYKPDELPLYTLSRLLWAAFGINRPELGRRTAPSANDRLEIDIYVALRSGLYRFDAGLMVLHPVLNQDIRAATGGQDFVADAPLNLIYVANLDRSQAGSDSQEEFYAALDTGFISQNVYLLCAAEGLSTVVRGWVDRLPLAALMGLGPFQSVIAAQSVGYPLA